MKFTVNTKQNPVKFPCLRSGLSSGDVYLVISDNEAIQFSRGTYDRFIHHKPFSYTDNTAPFYGSLTIEMD